MKNKIPIIIAFFLAMAILSNINFISAQSYCNPTIQLLNQDPLPANPSEYVTLNFQISGLSYDCSNGFAVELVPSYPFSLDANESAIQTLSSTPSGSQSWTISYKLRVDQNALPGDYNLEMFYHTGDSPDFSSALVQDFNISVQNVQTDFAVVVQSNTGTQVSLGIVNVGENAANSLIVGIPQQSGFRATGTSQQIIGNLAAGDYTVATFTLSQTGSSSRNSNPSGQNSGNQQNSNSTVMFNASSQTLQVEIDYTDIIGVRRTVIKNVAYSGSLSGNGTATGINGRFTSKQSSGISIWWFIGGGIILLGGATILFIRYRPKIKHYFSKKREKNSDKTPDWVLEERTHKK